MKKRAISFLLLMLMVMSLLPTPALAYYDTGRVEIAELDTPTLGYTLDTEVSVRFETLGIGFGTTLKGKVTWTPDYLFAEEKTEHTVKIEIIAASEPDFFENYRVDHVTLNGTKLVSANWSIDDWNALIVTYTFPATPAQQFIDNVHVTGLDAPVAGQPLDDAVDVAEEGAYMYSIEWTPADTVAKAGTEYTAQLIISCERSYPNYYYHLKALYLNGEELTGWPSSGRGYSIGEEGNILRIAYKFPPATGAAPQITSHPASVDALEGQDVTFSVTASGEKLHYEWWVVDAGTPQVVGGDSSVLTLKNVTVSEHNMYDYWCVVSNEFGEATSQKAHLNVFAEDTYVFPFTDVSEDAWYRGDVEIAHRSGLINGKTPTLYSPNDNMTVAEAIKLAACMHQLFHDDEVTLTNGSPLWYSTYVDYALDNSIIYAGYPGYDTMITRSAFVNIFYNALPVSAYSEINTVLDGKIPDVPMSGQFADRIYTFYRAGILTGSDEAGSFLPESNIRRSEVAAILTRMFDPAARRSIELK